MNSIFALVDCNNFFVSCERLFRPDLVDKPVVVLSNNDGCVVSRSNQAKALAIPMGAPAFQYAQLFKAQGVICFSANFELYGDISQRIIRLLTQVTPRTEVYSVDESFLELSQLDIKNYETWSDQLRLRVLKEVGIPVAIGIASSKTLAKLAGERAKKDTPERSILNLYKAEPQLKLAKLVKTPVGDIWGVGRRLAPKLRAEGIYNAQDLAELRPQLARQLMGVHGRQMVAELNGTSCLPLSPIGKPRQSIMHGRMFGEDTSDPSAIEAAIASLSAKAAANLRREGLLARTAVLQLSTNRHKPGYQRLSRQVQFNTPTADTGRIITELVDVFRAKYSPDVMVHRTNVLFYDLVSIQRVQADLFGRINLSELTSSTKRLQAYDYINDRYGKATISYAAESLSKAWQPRRALASPRYTTDWSDLPAIKG